MWPDRFGLHHIRRTDCQVVIDSFTFNNISISLVHDSNICELFRVDDPELWSQNGTFPGFRNGLGMSRDF